MCGIAGYLDFQQKTDTAVIETMTEALAHRGPEGSLCQLWEGRHAQIAFGHRRLAIIDLSEDGKQPRTDAESGLTITYNGEIYNYRELKAELTDLGQRFVSQTDTEVILKAFAQWGTAAVHRFIGIFAFALYDVRQQKVWLYRDRGGSKPLYYSWREGLFLFGSEIKALHSHPRFWAQLNRAALPIFLQKGYVPAPATIFEETFKLEPGHFLEIDLPTASLNKFCYWNAYHYYQKPKLNLSATEALLETERLLRSACQYRLVADVPVGIFLSGGYDSSLVTALLQQEHTTKIRTFCIGFVEKNFDEAPYARAVAQHLGTAHHTFYCNSREAQALIPTLPYYYDEPLADSAAIPTLLLSKYTRRSVKVALSADAGDELFAGYAKYAQIARFRDYLRRWSPDARDTAARWLGKTAQMGEYVPASLSRWGVRYRKTVELLPRQSAVMAMEGLEQTFTAEELSYLLPQEPLVPRPLPDYADLGWLDAMLCADYQDYMPNDLLAKVDRATMSVGLEGREPLLDHRLLEFVATLPDAFKYRPHQQKYLLRQIVHKYLPPELMERPKMGFSVPIARWMQHDLRALCEAYLNENRMREAGIFHPEAVQMLRRGAEAGRAGFGKKVWHLLVFELWRSQWLR